MSERFVPGRSTRKFFHVRNRYHVRDVSGTLVRSCGPPARELLAINQKYGNRYAPRLSLVRARSALFACCHVVVIVAVVALILAVIVIIAVLAIADAGRSITARINRRWICRGINLSACQEVNGEMIPSEN